MTTTAKGKPIRHQYFSRWKSGKHSPTDRVLNENLRPVEALLDALDAEALERLQERAKARQPEEARA